MRKNRGRACARRRRKLWLILAAVGLVATVVTACRSATTGLRHPDLLGQADRTPVVFISGVTGSTLHDRATDRVEWGNAARLFSPRDGGRALALPLSPAAPSWRQLEAGAPLWHVRLAFWRKEVYGPVAQLMRDNGYRLGRLSDPRPDDSFFFFVYDWRHDNLTSARLLADQLERLRQVRGPRSLQVNLICQSNAGRICRYFAKYRGAGPSEAPAAATDRLAVDKLILVGTSNGGSLRVLHMLNRGRRYVPLVGRKWQPETLFTVRPLYEDLPTYRQDLFFGRDGEPITVDLFAVESWQRFGWSVFAEDVARRLRRRPDPEVFGEAADRVMFIRRQLERARLLQQLLETDSPQLGATRYYLLANRTLETPERALLVEEAGRWQTYFASDPEVRRVPRLRAIAAGAGDGHATLASQYDLSAQEKRALALPPAALGGGHFEIVLQRETQQKILDYLAD